MSIEDILKERGSRYGEFRYQAEIAQDIKRAMNQTPGWQNLADFQKESLEMIANKIARALNGDPNHHDTWYDIEGYAKLVSDKLVPVKHG